MEERAVCFYCATVYPGDQAKCPLCGSTKRAEDFVIPQRRERVTEEERKRRQKGGKFAAQKEPVKKTTKKKAEIDRKPFLLGALIFLLLAVLILFWFIADMIGWLPGLENTIDREEQPGVSVNVGCSQLLAEPARLEIMSLGQTVELKISVNASCGETLYCTSNNPSVATLSQVAATEEGTELKSAVFQVTAVAEGATVITISCGNETVGVPVTVADLHLEGNGTPDASEIGAPELNWQEVEFTTMGDSVTLKVTNLREGATVIWMSGDESVATVDANGVVTSVGSGETTITCDVDGKTTQVKIRCDIRPTETTNDDGAHLERGKEDVSVNVGDTFPLYLYNSKSEHIEDIAYVVDDAAICEVVDNHVRALSKGTTKIRVIYGDREFICIVRVS